MTLELDPASGLLRQPPSPELARHLAAAYRVMAMSTGTMEDRGLGGAYLEGFLTFLDQGPGPRIGSGSRVLEVGCGGGRLLERLAARGAVVRGIEPGGGDCQRARDRGVTVVEGFFPHPDLAGPFDLIVAHMVLEHIESPGGFLAAVAACLAPGGRLLLAVPDVEPLLWAGDPSFLFPEHLLYFTPASLDRVLADAGFATLARGAGVGCNFYALATPAENGSVIDAPPLGGHAPDPAMTVAAARAFPRRLDEAVARLRARLEAAVREDRSLGIWVPNRAANLLTLVGMGTGAGPTRLRFFDDNPALTGTWLPGLAPVIEDRAAFVAHPTDEVLIFSPAFAEVIATSLAAAVGDRPPRCGGWRDLFPETRP